MERIILHIDVNNAFLSWSACNRLNNGETLDIRTIPSIIGGDVKQRQGIVLAKSEIAKKCGIKTGETLHKAKEKCKNLQIYPPDFKIYKYYSDAMYKILCEYSDEIERYSIDECFLDYTYMQLLYGKPLDIAKQISKRIYDELGFTVNIGIGNNKLLAKMASELEKPNKINTIYYSEVKKKMWPLPIEELFMTGRKTTPELRKYNIRTIGDLAVFDKNIIEKRFGKMGKQMHNYANGLDDSEVDGGIRDYKGIGNSITTNVDIKDIEIANTVILSICECVGKRLRHEGMYTKCISVSIKDSNFEINSHQRKLHHSTNVTQDIYEISKMLLKEMWKGQSIRSFGVRLDDLSKYEEKQLSIFNNEQESKKKKSLDEAIDKTRNKYGDTSIKRATFVNTNITPILNNKDKN